jgi:hypothetical protein
LPVAAAAAALAVAFVSLVPATTHQTYPLMVRRTMICTVHLASASLPFSYQHSAPWLLVASAAAAPAPPATRSKSEEVRRSQKKSEEVRRSQKKSEEVRRSQKKSEVRKNKGILYKDMKA